MSSESADSPQHMSPPMASVSDLAPFRIWPAALLLLAMLLARLAPVLINDGPPNIWMASSFGPLVGSGLLLLWWILLSRATWGERLLGTVGVLSALGLTMLSLHQTMTTIGVGLFTVPVGMSAFGLASVVLGRLKTRQRTVLIVLLTSVGFGAATLFRMEGMSGNDYGLDLKWRWTPTAEQILETSQSGREPGNLNQYSDSDMDTWLAQPEWSGFRGHDGIAHQPTGLQIAADWSTHPPQELWRVPIGPGWSSFAVAGKLLFTQEQRGEQETISCYSADNGQEIWTQQVQTRFEEPLGGPGPRATPTLDQGRLFVQGANGHVLRLNPRTGDVVWTQDLKELTGRKPPEWGYSSSPLVRENQVVVYAGGPDGNGVLALDANSGDVTWSAPTGDHSYSSPLLCRLNDEEIIVMLSNDGVTLLNPNTGAVRLEYDWPVKGYRAIQPHVIDSNSLLIPTGNAAGTRRLKISSQEGSLSAEVLWTSMRLKPDFNDFVVYAGCAWGFDNRILTCVDLETGKTRWKGGRYGKGQLILMRESKLLLVTAEQGDLVLLRANPDQHEEVARIRAFDDKNWNHPVIVGNRLYVRNGHEAVCYQLPEASTDTDVVQQQL